MLLAWFRKGHRDLPWRKTRDPYRIWLSEVILQQTRVQQGLPYYEKFLSNFPDIQALAKADEMKVLRLWQGLGYYNRAKNLHACAKTIMKEYGGKFPRKTSELQELPGIGTYTAAAIASFCFREVIPVLDGNVYRFLARYFGIKDDITSSKTRKEMKDLADNLISEEHPDLYNQAIMEFGATFCTPSNPQCEACPFQTKCYACNTHSQTKLPFKSPKVNRRQRFLHYFIFRYKDRILMKRRGENDIWGKLYDFYLIEQDRKNSFDPMEKLNEAVHLNLNNSILVERTVHAKHKLTHQQIFSEFLELKVSDLKTFNHLKKTLQLKDYSKEQIRKLPKPILINNYLYDYIF